ADVVLYDYLVSDEIMELCRRDAELICVGKRASYHSVSQEETNALLVKHAQEGRRVVRLKGGDPFMFGRGGEELQVLQESGVPFQVVPGITAAAGATAYAGIPLTHRDHAQTAMFVTGHLKKEDDSFRWATLARGRQTLVIYMGLMKSAHIQEQLIQHGRDPQTPVAIIENGTRINQKIYKGTLSELESLAEGVGSPALIVVGEVVQLADQLSWFGKQSFNTEGDIHAPSVVNLG
ncbi:uroporphyrinogen-III C-methyltransferase, partial [Enterovibrio norvegicus FF-162]